MKKQKVSIFSQSLNSVPELTKQAPNFVAISTLYRDSRLAFIAVGCSAAAVHQGVVMLLVQNAWLTPLIANFVGFLAALPVSYYGHYYLTFNVHLPHRQTLPRFILVATIGFVGNQLFYALLLGYTSLNYAVALFIVLLTVAISTYILSKLWVFSPRDREP